METLDDLGEAPECGGQSILRDNFSLDTMAEAGRLKDGRASLEVSGCVTKEMLRSTAESGIDRISVGGVTKHLKAVDFSMRFEVFGARPNVASGCAV